MLYPLLRGEDVKRWYAEPSSYIIVPNDPKTGDIYSERDLKISFPKTYEFLLKFKEQLKNRTHYGTSISKSKMPFYMLFQVNKESFSDFKVVWKEISGEISGKGDFASSVVLPYNTFKEKKCVIADHKLMIIPFTNEDESYFVNAILNSSIARLIVASSTIETSMSTHILKHIRIPRYDKKNTIHDSIVKESMKSQQLYSNKSSLQRAEAHIDNLVANLFDINSNELDIINKSLKVLLP